MTLPIVYHSDYVTPLPADHRFPMPKFGRIYQALLRDGLAGLDQFHHPQPAVRSLLALVHQCDYIDAYLHGTLDAKAMRRIGFPWSPQLVTRTCTAVGGTVTTARLALEHGVACNTAGGTHHAHPAFGSGFCIFNDLAVAARAMQQERRAARVLIVDLDVHQGDGTAAIFAGDESVFTFSLHCEKNFPFRKHPGDLDVGLAVGAGDDVYLETLAWGLEVAIARARPDLVLFDAGVDPHRDDRLGKLTLSDDGLYRRDRFVLDVCAAAGLPVACVVGGGYGADIEQLARRHTIVFRAATDLLAA